MLSDKTKYCITGKLTKEQYSTLTKKLPISCRYMLDTPKGIDVFNRVRKLTLGQLLHRKNMCMIICTNSFVDYEIMAERCRSWGINCIHYAMLLGILPVFVELGYFTDKKLEWSDNNGNSIKCYAKPVTSKGIICITGNDNKVSFGAGFKPNRRIMVKCLGSGNTVAFGKQVAIGNTEAYTEGEYALKVITANKGTVKVFNRTTIGGAMLRATNGGSIIINADCMFGWDINIWQSPGHMIFDNSTGEMTNKVDDVILGRHCWLGKGVALMGGAQLADNCVVGYGSLTSSKFTEPNCIIAGAPAKVIRRDACWTRDFVTGGAKRIEECKDKVGYNIVQELKSDIDENK